MITFIWSFKTHTNAISVSQNRPLRQKTQCPVFNRKREAASVSTMLPSGKKHYKPYGELIRLLLILVITHNKQQYDLQLPGNPEGVR